MCLSSSEVAAEIGFSVYPLGDEESPVYNQISMESEMCSSHSTTDDGREDEGRTAPSEPGFPSYLSCRGCGQLRDGPLGPGIDLVGPYCLRCCKASREAKATDFCASFAGVSGMRGGSHLQLEAMVNGMGDKSLTAEDKLAKQHACQLCGFSSRYANHVKRHMKTHNGEKPYHCPLCAYASAQLVNLQRHLRIHTGEKPYKCDRCTFACSSLGNLKRHQRMHVQTAGTGQDAAGAPALGQISQKRQMSGQRPNEEVSAASAKGRIHLLNFFFLSQFSKTQLLLSSSGVVSEVAQATSDLSLEAQNSDYLSAFDSMKGASLPTTAASNAGPGHQPLPLHQPAGGSSNRAPRGGGGGGGAGGAAGGPTLQPSLFPYTCRLCGVVLEDEDGTSAQICAKCTLEMLTKDTSSSPSSPGERSDKVYTCAACPFLTHYPNHLARHMKTHSGEKPYKCPQCDYASAHFDNLKRHHRVHTGEKHYKCHLCDYACGNLANLKRHQRVHSGAKPFQCAVCSYSCNQSMNLKRHMLRHTGEKPYKCRECGYTTGHWDNYKRHQKKHGLATDGWVKVPMTANDDEEEDEEDEEEEKGLGGGAQAHRKETEVNMQYVFQGGRSESALKLLQT